MHTGDSGTPKFRPSLFGGKPAADTSERADRSNGFGFGSQGEKQAGLKGTRQRCLRSKENVPELCLAGFLISKPTDAVPSYAPRPTSFDSSLLSVVEPNTTAPGDTKASTFRSSPTAI
jgi:hypothetical protein